MNEAETRAEHIDPALRAAGWGTVEGSRILREYPITPGRIEGHAGRRARPEIADYILVYRNQKLAVIEAKAWDLPITEGLDQAKRYAAKLAVRFAYSTNGQGIYFADLGTSTIPGSEGPVDRYPTPEELWSRAFAEENAWRDRFAAIPLETKAGSWSARYYQEIAVNRVLEAVAANRDRLLLTLATGTGKTAIAFQIVWKLFQTRWTLARDGQRRPRILFLADRNNLADQAYNEFTAFAAFSEDALARIAPDDIRKKGRVPKNASVFFTIFQTFLSGPEVDGVPQPYFGEYPADFFDFIIIDECHRGGANDESTWRGILEYFAPAVQLGLTATPKRRDNVDTYAYFGEPVYIYSLRAGINDGFLTPFKVKQVATTIDDYVYTPDDTVVEGEIEEGHRYIESEFNRKIVIDERERYRVKRLMELLGPSGQREKTLVFCANQPHALAVRDLINQLKSNSDPLYCVRVTANDGAAGDQYLRDFQDNEKTIPTILTTSQKLSTGVDARNVRNIALLRPVNSMIEFKQIIGRGTRLYDGKDFFTIFDFVRAHHHFNDPEWDGEPLEPEPAPEPQPRPDPLPEPGAREGEVAPRPQRIKIKLADGKERTFQSMTATSFWSADGRPISAAQFLENLYGALPEFFKDEDELRKIWSLPDTRKAFLLALEEKGFGIGPLTEIQRAVEAEDSDLYDVLRYVAFTLQPLSRAVRAETAKRCFPTRFSDRQQAFLNFVLAQYVKEGIQELDEEKLSPLLRLKYNTLTDGRAELGDLPQVRNTFVAFQELLYRSPEATP